MMVRGMNYSTQLNDGIGKGVHLISVLLLLNTNCVEVKNSNILT